MEDNQFPGEFDNESHDSNNQVHEKKDHILSCYTNSDLVEIQLLKMLHDANTPHYLYKDILEWAKHSSELNYNFNPGRTNRSGQLKHIEKWFGLDYLRPKQVMIKLPGPTESVQEEIIPVTCFNFTNMLKSLFSDKKLFGSIDDLDVNIQDPFDHYRGETNHIDCANAGTWYRKAWKNLCKEENDFLVPIIFACDETTMGKCGACPLLFTTTLLKQKHRNKASAWRPLGFIYDLNLIKSNNQNKRMSGDMKCLRLHSIFKAVLQSFKDAQKGNI